MSKKTVSAIISSGNHYIIQVKGNQRNLYHQIRLNTAEDKKAISISETKESKRGREECRKVFLFKNTDDISADWEGLKRLVRIERHVTVADKARHETAYYISNVKKNSANYFAMHIHNHWGIETHFTG